MRLRGVVAELVLCTDQPDRSLPFGDLQRDFVGEVVFLGPRLGPRVRNPTWEAMIG